MRLNLISRISIVALAAFSIVACKDQEPPDFHFEYFGLEQGRYVVYDVVEIIHDSLLQQHDTMRYQMKTKWGDVYIDNEGREGREYFVYKRDSVSQPWALTDLWYGLYDGIRAELIEENQRTVKLVFAPTLLKEWDANAYNTSEALDCYYRDIHQDTTLNGIFIDSTLVVEQERDTNLITSIHKYEMYAKNIGMVYKHYRDNYYQFGSPSVYLGRELYVTYLTSGFE